MSLWCTRFCGFFPCCPIPASRNKAESNGIVLATQSSVSEIVKNQPATQSRSDDALKELFRKFLPHEARELDSKQLHDILNGYFVTGFNFEGFSHDLCRSMVAMRDADQSGSMGYKEFQQVWRDLESWREAFQKRDSNKKGYFDKSEFIEIFHSLGLDVRHRTVQAMSVRYSGKDGRVSFSDFVSAALRLQLMTETWKLCADGGESARFKTDEFIQLALYA